MDQNVFEYKDLYLETAREYIQSLNKNLLILEKSPKDIDATSEIFRSAHSLKSQSGALGFSNTGFLCHVIEDVFYEIKQGKKDLNSNLADLLFKAFDSLESSINSIEKDSKEIDVLEVANSLKEATGVETVGAGKSFRDDNLTENETLETKKVNIEITNPPASFNITSPIIKTINVKVEQLDEMMNLLEQLLVARLKLKRILALYKLETLNDYYDEISSVIDDLHFQILKARLVPLKKIFEHYPRAIRDLGKELNKQVEIEILGADLEIDRSIVDRLDEPIIHLLRNSVSHGILKEGRVEIEAKKENDNLILSIKDNGRGIDWESIKNKTNLSTSDPILLKKALFSGISTAKDVSVVSGRGVGLQVVEKMVQSVGGSIDIESIKDKGTTFILKLPLSLAVVKALLVKVGKEKYALPSSLIDRSINLDKSQINKIADQEIFIWDEHRVPLIRLQEKFKLASQELDSKDHNLLTLLVSAGDEKLGLVVDDVVETLEIIVKPIPEILKTDKAFSGTTILGDGNTTLILNPQGLI